VRVDPTFDARHDVKELARQARFYAFVGRARAAEVQDHVATVYDRWRNDHRYRSQADITAWLGAQGLDRGIGGASQRLRLSAHRIVHAAEVIVMEGDARWKRGRA
jgi:hypothetical protein